MSRPLTPKTLKEVEVAILTANLFNKGEDYYPQQQEILKALAAHVVNKLLGWS
jgi:hypothetical protein